MELARGTDVIPYAEAVNVLADALGRLGARIHRDIDVEALEAGPLKDPEVEETLQRFSAFADECLRALEDHRVLAALQLAEAPPVASRTR